MTITPRALESLEERTTGRRTYGLNDTIRNIAPTTLRGAVTFVGIAAATIATLSAGNVASAEILPGGDIVSPPTACTSTIVDTRLIEWDFTQVPAMANDDSIVGALTVDDQSSSKQSKLLFVTRASNTRLYRFTPGKGIKKDKAEARSWELGALQTGGVRVRHSNDGRNVFVNTNLDGVVSGLVQVDMQANTRVTWVDRPHQDQMSDVSVDTRGGHSVFTAALIYQDKTGMTDGTDGVIQRLRPSNAQLKNGKWIVPAEATRWLVGGGAGSCQDTGVGAPCIPGVEVDRRRGHPIYFSAPDFPAAGGSGSIGVLDPQPVKCTASDSSYGCGKVKYFQLPAVDAMTLPVFGPRQILIDEKGKVWGVTSSGHLFSFELDKYSDKGVFTIHNPEGPLAAEDLFAVSPDGGIIGFTDSENQEVSILVPDRFEKKVNAVAVKNVPRVTRNLEGIREPAPAAAYLIDPREANAVGTKYTKVNDGTYVETSVNTGVTDDGSSPSLNPTGMAPDGARKSGSFFYGVGDSTSSLGLSNRVGHFEAKVEPDRELEYRKDDDDFDDDGDDNQYDTDDDNDGIPDDMDNDDDNDCILDHMDNDDDNDGVEDEHDSKSNRENKRTDRGQMAAGQWKEYEVESDSHSLAMVAIVEAADLTTPFSIEVVDPNGVVVLSVPTVAGKAIATTTPALAGVYTMRVKNSGSAPATYKTTVINKQIWY